MSRFCKFLHLLGLTLFLGSIFGHIVAGVLAGAPGDPAFVAARAEIVHATRLLTLPGLGLLIASGAGMLAAARLSPLKIGWLAAHVGGAALIVINTAAFIVPAGIRALALAKAGDYGEALGGALLTEDGFGAANVALALALIALGLYKPTLFRRGAATA
ncbi:hypothetical protein CCR94_13420 [Rhodoblastus sphagnicola]|uniref:DUF2269 family protein n=1 Tax=Rhodoblastus sphagnicola TaxID=333368 RepID=A0A2S6N644_9HYPH|nr:DUF2269 family protein [Rhodoblastus sphagnicola]MBB4196343.1 putative membrane protein [Rhodoblastus sphagnicola]PPQ30093.1 hypothetical protein CCR94_13420 [Rhodoblastus sphagnicola]